MLYHKNGKIWALCSEIQKSRLENRSMLEDIYGRLKQKFVAQTKVIENVRDEIDSEQK
jgi:hypothetical protein